MTTPYHAGMPCDPLTIPEDAEVTYCSECPVSMLGRGTLRHLDVGYHEWNAYRDPKPSLLARIRALLTRGNR